MGTILAELNSRVFFGFGDSLPPEYLPLVDVHNAVTQKHSVRLNLSRISDINVLLALTSDFTASTDPIDITNLVSKGVPSFVETYSDSDGWQPIKVVNIVNLSASKDAGETACAFYGDESNGNRQYVQFANPPDGHCRIRFDKDNAPDLLNNTSALPNYVSELIVLEAMNMLIPRISMRVVNNQQRKKQTTQDVQLILGVLTNMRQQNTIDMQDLLNLWKVWAYRDRAAQNATETKQPIPLGKNLYL